MVYRLDDFEETSINPITNSEWDASWIIYILNEESYKMSVGCSNECAYTLKVSKKYRQWEMTLGDFLSYNNSIEKNIILVISKSDYQEALQKYKGHTHNERFLSEYEEPVLVHSTTEHNFCCIKNDGCLKSWNQLHKCLHTETEPIGKKLGDPIELRDFILFGSGTTGEIVVNSKQCHKIEMNENVKYKTGARLYFDIKKLQKMVC